LGIVEDQIVSQFKAMVEVFHVPAGEPLIVQGEGKLEFSINGRNVVQFLGLCEYITVEP